MKRRMHHNYTMLMSRALDREASPDEEHLLSEHLEACPDCAAIWKQWQSLHKVLLAAPMLTPPQSCADAVLARLDGCHWSGS
jgi:predicted anti-sigma-YlaC factor YlaD